MTLWVSAKQTASHIKHITEKKKYVDQVFFRLQGKTPAALRDFCPFNMKFQPTADNLILL